MKNIHRQEYFKGCTRAGRQRHLKSESGIRLHHILFTGLGLDEYPLDERVFALDLLIEPVYCPLYIPRRRPVRKIKAYVRENEIGPHVEREYFVYVLDEFIRVRDLPYAPDDRFIRALSYEQPLRFICESADESIVRGRSEEHT